MPKGTSFAVFTFTTETFWMSILKCLQNLGKRKKYFDYLFMLLGFPDGSESKKNLPLVQETRVLSLGQEDLLEMGMVIHSSYACLENSMNRGA